MSKMTKMFLIDLFWQLTYYLVWRRKILDLDESKTGKKIFNFININVHIFWQLHNVSASHSDPHWPSLRWSNRSPESHRHFPFLRSFWVVFHFRFLLVLLLSLLRQPLRLCLSCPSWLLCLFLATQNKQQLFIEVIFVFKAKKKKKFSF